MDVRSLEEALEKEKRSDSWCGVEGIKKELTFNLLLDLNFSDVSLSEHFFLLCVDRPVYKKSGRQPFFPNKQEQNKTLHSAFLTNKFKGTNPFANLTLKSHPSRTLTVSKMYTFLQPYPFLFSDNLT